MQALNKIRLLRQRINQLGLQVKIEVDGGITLTNAQSVIDAGAHVLVAGSSVFKSPDPLAAIKQYKRLLAVDYLPQDKN